MQKQERVSECQFSNACSYFWWQECGSPGWWRSSHPSGCRWSCRSTFFPSPCLLLPPRVGEGRVFPCLLARWSGSWLSFPLATGAGQEPPPGQKLKWNFTKMLNWPKFFPADFVGLGTLCFFRRPYTFFFFFFGKPYTFSMQSVALPRDRVPIPNPLLLPGIRADVGSCVHYRVA